MNRGKGSARRRKQGEGLTRIAQAAVEREPAGKQEARESGYGSSRGESSEGTELQGRERHGRRPRSLGADVEQDGLSRARTSTGAARTVEREPNPEDGTGEGLATLASTDEPRGKTVESGAPLVDVSREQEAQERRIPLSRTPFSLRRGKAVSVGGRRRDEGL